MMSYTDEELLEKFEQRLIEQKWIPQLESNYELLPEKKHRRDIQNIPDIEQIKDNICAQLHPLAVKEWLKLCSNLPRTYGPFRSSEKCLLLLLQLLNGCPRNDITVPMTTYTKTYKKVWEDPASIEKMHKWSTEWFERFSDSSVRLMHATVFNPLLFKHVTLIVDGKDITIRLINLNSVKGKTKNGKSTLKGKKLQFKNGGRQQLIMDCRGMTIDISDTKGANEIYDGHHLKQFFKTWNSNVTTYFNPLSDCLIMDSHFISETVKFVETTPNYFVNNLCVPMVKQKNTPLSNEEVDYKKSHGAFRSIIETEKFAQFTKKFKCFGPTNRLFTTDFASFNIQFRVAMVLFDIHNYVNKYPHRFKDDFEVDVYRLGMCWI